ncbi:MAG: hypothetical protein JWO83_147 [Caulobacteraceae bacterium]|nr:hypothetical protein [Caulobacteraceae bacterium]
MPIETQPNDIKERLSIAYVTAVAARAGCQISQPDIDKQSIDVTVRPVSGRKLAVDLQLKATSTECVEGGEVIFSLPVKNYDDLRDKHCTAPHFLIVLVLDPDDSLWLTSDEDALLIRRCAYWADLRGQPETTNQATITVKIPCSQRFDVEALRDMMTHALALASPPEEAR